jgi:tetratricopeptide (TPR) repeat protein
VFSWSYRALTDDAARLFRQLGLHPGPDFTRAAAASLAGTSAPRVRSALSELVGAHLIQELHIQELHIQELHIQELHPSRFAMHDLLQAYAHELAHTHDPPSDRDAGTRRMLDHYLHTAHAAAMALHPHRHPIHIEAPEPGALVDPISDAEQAQAWFAAEQRVLQSVVGHAARHEWAVHTWQLAWTLTDHLDRHGRWHDQFALQRLALAAARRLGDAGAQAHAHRAIARAAVQLGRPDEAGTHYRAALDLFDAVGDGAGQAHTHLGLSWMLERQGRIAEAVDHDRQALALFRALDHRLGLARAHSHLGTHHSQLGDHSQALVDCGAALAIFEEVGDRLGRAATLDSLGQANQHLGRHGEAVTCYQKSVDLVRAVGDRYYEAVVLRHLGEAHAHLGARGPAREAWLAAADILDELQHADADAVRASLAALG